MRVETAFDPARNLIIVEGEISGPLGETPLRLVLDTGAAESLIVPDVVDALGYSPRDAEVVTGVYPDVRIHVFDLADRYGIDGLIGLSFLRHFNYEIHSAEGRIFVERIASG